MQKPSIRIKKMTILKPNYSAQINSTVKLAENLMQQINFTKHPAERDLATEELNNILMRKALEAEREILAFLSRYVTFDYLAGNNWGDDEGLQDISETSTQQ